MTTAILFIIAAWGWYCLVEFSDGSPIAGFILIPTVMPLVIALTLVGRACNSVLGVLAEMFVFVADWEARK